MSFPVPGTLMIEPTESESKAELDRFCEAMIAIRKEIAEVENGRFKIEASPLRHAPHTVHDIADDEWKRAYGRAEGCFPAGCRARTNTGPRSAASTMSMATATWCAPVRRFRTTRRRRSEGQGCHPGAALSRTRKSRRRGLSGVTSVRWRRPSAISQVRAAPPTIDRVWRLNFRSGRYLFAKRGDNRDQPAGQDQRLHALTTSDTHKRNGRQRRRQLNVFSARSLGTSLA